MAETNDTQATETTQATEAAQATETAKTAEATTQEAETTKGAEAATPAEAKQTEAAKASEAKATEPDYKAQAADYAARAIRAEARAALSALGVPAARLDAAVKIAELTGINPSDAKAGEKIAAAAQKVLELVPEFKGGAGTGSTVATPRKTGTLDDFERGYLGAK